jgi:hypothetical protein
MIQVEGCLHPRLGSCTLRAPMRSLAVERRPVGRTWPGCAISPVLSHRRALALLLLPVGLLAAACAPASSAATGSPVPAPLNGPATSVAPRPVVYDNTLAARACTLLEPAEIAEAFAEPVVGPATPVDPYCQWNLGANTSWVSLQVFPGQDLAAFRKAWGAARVADAAVADGGFWANNKALAFADAGTTYVLVHQVSGAWDDRSRPAQLAAAKKVVARLHGGTPAPAPAALSAPAPVDLKRSATAADPLRVWVGGDSLAGGPSWALGDRLAKAPAVRTHREFQVGSGLNRPDFFDWHRHLAAQVDAYHPEAMVLMFGGNDTQPVTVDGKGIAIDDPRWAEVYRQRVSAVLDVTATDGRAVVWVGLPPMKEAKLSAGVAKINQIVAAEVANHPGAVFLDIWPQFSAKGRPGTYTGTIDVKGRPREVRLDGIHLNTDGSIVLADLVLPLLRQVSPSVPAAG